MTSNQLLALLSLDIDQLCDETNLKRSDIKKDLSQCKASTLSTLSTTYHLSIEFLMSDDLRSYVTFRQKPNDRLVVHEILSSVHHVIKKYHEIPLSHLYQVYTKQQHDKKLQPIAFMSFNKHVKSLCNEFDFSHVSKRKRFCLKDDNVSKQLAYELGIDISPTESRYLVNNCDIPKVDTSLIEKLKLEQQSCYDDEDDVFSYMKQMSVYFKYFEELAISQLYSGYCEYHRSINPHTKPMGLKSFTKRLESISSRLRLSMFEDPDNNHNRKVFCRKKDIFGLTLSKVLAVSDQPQRSRYLINLDKSHVITRTDLAEFESQLNDQVEFDSLTVREKVMMTSLAIRGNTIAMQFNEVF